MDWKGVKVPKGSRLFRNHKFTYMHGGSNFIIEIDELLVAKGMLSQELISIRDTQNSKFIKSINLCYHFDIILIFLVNKHLYI